MIAISATFVAEPLADPLGLLLGEAGISDEVCFAPYHQTFQELLDVGSAFGRNAGGVNVLLVRLEDFVRDAVPGRDSHLTIQRTASELGEAIEHFLGRSKGVLLLAVLPPSPAISVTLATAIREAADGLVERVGGHPALQIIDPLAVDALACDARFDLTRDKLAHIPFSQDYYAALALVLARRIHCIRVPAAKVLVLDCDNTIWGGVVGEDGVEGIRLEPGHLALQAYAVEQQARGVLVCLASKNSEQDVLQVFEQRADMLLKIDHIVAHRINWQPKPANLQALAAELNLGLDAFVFLDDNPVECGQMQAELPQVVTLQVPAEAGIARLLEHLWTFDKLVTTAEDANRTRMYRENSARRALESSVSDISQFMAALELRIDIAPPADDEWPRIEQLTQRTNQFNFTTRRRSVAELRQLVAEGAEVLRVRVADRFGDYGLVGAMVAVPAAASLRIDTLLLSCRVLGRGVEHAMLQFLGARAEALGLDRVDLEFFPTPRNEPARAFADSVAADSREVHADGAVYRIATAAARAIRHRPGEDPIEVVQARLADERKAARPSVPKDPGGHDRSAGYARLATALRSGPEVRRAVAARPALRRKLPQPPLPATTDAEQRLLDIWENVLGISGLGIDDDYFALGGTSLMSVQLFADIEHGFDTSLRLTAILEAPTVRLLARLILESGESGRNGLVCLRPGGDRKLFLVHDGLGETLLYLNLAQRMPAGIAVYGIEPRRLPGIPMAHASIEEMADYYVQQVRAAQTTGPYLLGGMCAGGVIAYAMAAQLTRSGEQVDMVTILDGATPQAPKRAGRVSGERLSRLQSTMHAQQAQASLPARAATLAALVLRKGINVVRYELQSFGSWISASARFRLMQRLVRSGAGWPAFLPELTIPEIYAQLEAAYTPPSLARVPVLLARASVGEESDTPYREIYLDEDFGWRRVAGHLMMADVRGGHASMLQEHFVDSLSSLLRGHLFAEQADREVATQ